MHRQFCSTKDLETSTITISNSETSLIDHEKAQSTIIDDFLALPSSIDMQRERMESDEEALKEKAEVNIPESSEPFGALDSWGHYFVSRGYDADIVDGSNPAIVRLLTAGLSCPMTLFHALTGTESSAVQALQGNSDETESRSYRMHVLGATMSQEQVLLEIYWSELSELLGPVQLDAVLVGPDIKPSPPPIKTLVQDRFNALMIKNDYASFMNRESTVDLSPDLCVAFNSGLASDHNWQSAVDMVLDKGWPLLCTANCAAHAEADEAFLKANGAHFKTPVAPNPFASFFLEEDLVVPDLFVCANAYSWIVQGRE